ncbi:glycosyltransferase [Candidatus Sulfidibacterium hydrothermale]|uniref:glycosyltransferase n=1 Tax=Candidatus Sulfidibacterium hydrothermale TaxID=2875962 RepID=UPI001F0B3DD9|nr:glycosyltransferase [Candidatus Sulfidibacterium hydrothermale]UBM61207.1 glycosyltransferase [Candidatus Sulfidibacterium hydrothermale]
MNKTAQYEMTIVVPVYNEQDSIYRLEKTLADYLPKAAVKTCVLLVNDGSKDDSLTRIKEVCARQNDFYFISLAKNGGLSTALKAGFDHSESKLTAYIDADLQTTPEDFNLLLPHITEYEMVIGIRTGRKDSFVKKMSSKIANSYRRMMTHDGIIDTGCPLKIMRTEYAKKFPLFDGMHRFLPALIQLEDGKVKQVPVRHFPRQEGESKYHLFNRLAGPFIDCFAYRWMKKRYIRYQIDQKKI